MIEYNWIVSQMDAYPEYEGHTDIVFTVHWRLDGTDGTHSAGVYGSIGLTLDPAATFTPYANLTKAQVVGWIEDAMGEEQVAQYKSNIDSQIDALVNPTTITPRPPWA